MALVINDTPTSTMLAGTVANFDSERGFGFIRRDDGQADTFLHVSALHEAGLGEVRPGDRLAFALETDSRSGRPRAARVRLLPSAAGQGETGDDAAPADNED